VESFEMLKFRNAEKLIRNLTEVGIAGRDKQ
jgi:hypothetical protein